MVYHWLLQWMTKRLVVLIVISFILFLSHIYVQIQKTDDLTEYKNQAKILFKRLSVDSDTRCSIETGHYIFQLSV